jgi:hypothetical protein
MAGEEIGRHVEVIAEVESDRARQDLATAWAHWRDRQRAGLGVRGGFANDVICLRLIEACAAPSLGNLASAAERLRRREELDVPAWTFFGAIGPARPGALRPARELTRAIRDLGRVSTRRSPDGAGPGRGSDPRAWTLLRELAALGRLSPALVLERAFPVDGRYGRLEWSAFQRTAQGPTRDAGASAAFVDACRAAFEQQGVELGWMSLVDDRERNLEIVAATCSGSAAERQRVDTAFFHAAEASRELGYGRAIPLRAQGLPVMLSWPRPATFSPEKRPE